MKKTLWISAVALLATITVPAQTPTTDPGAEVGGVVWATRNVDAPGTFADTPESAGMLYQWNRRVGWSAEDPLVNTAGQAAWDRTTPTGETWVPGNDPCPTGWRVPTLEELRKLAISGVSREPVGDGLKIIDPATGHSIHLPVTKSRNGDDGTINTYDYSGNYWSSIPYSKSGNGYFLIVDTDASIANSAGLNAAHSVRCVTDMRAEERAAAVGGGSGRIEGKEAPKTVPETASTPPAVKQEAAPQLQQPAVEPQATVQPLPPSGQPEQRTVESAPAFQQGREATIVGTWVSEFVPILGVTAVYTFYENGACTMLHINKDGFYEDFSWYAVTGKDLSTGYTWEKTEDKTITLEGYDPIRVQTICTSKDNHTECFSYTGGDAFQWSVYKFTRATSPDQVPEGKVKEAIVTPVDTGSLIIGTFEGAQEGCSWMGRTGEIMNPGTFTFSADGTTDYIKVDEPIYWGTIESGVEKTMYVREGCDSKPITAKADYIRIGTKYHDGSWKQTSWMYVFEHEGFVYIDAKKHKRVK